jgi:hypothetical protein
MDALEGLDSLAIELSRNRVFWQAPVQHQVRELPLSLLSPTRVYNTYRRLICAASAPPAPQAMATRLQTHSHVDAVTADAMNNLAVRPGYIYTWPLARPLSPPLRCVCRPPATPLTRRANSPPAPTRGRAGALCDPRSGVLGSPGPGRLGPPHTPTNQYQPCQRCRADGPSIVAPSSRASGRVRGRCVPSLSPAALSPCLL